MSVAALRRAMLHVLQQQQLPVHCHAQGTERPASPTLPAGLVLALGTGVLFQAAQPALLYLVPCTLGPVAARAATRGEWGDLWGGQRMEVAPGKQEEPEEAV